MIVYGFAKSYKFLGDGTLSVQVRIPSIHGPYKQSNYNGQSIHGYTLDSNLPYYKSLVLQNLPSEGDVVALIPTNDAMNDFLVIGLTGGAYHTGIANIQD